MWMVVIMGFIMINVNHNNHNHWLCREFSNRFISFPFPPGLPRLVHWTVSARIDTKHLGTGGTGFRGRVLPESTAKGNSHGSTTYPAVGDVDVVLFRTKVQGKSAKSGFGFQARSMIRSVALAFISWRMKKDDPSRCYWLFTLWPSQPLLSKLVVLTTYCKWLETARRESFQAG
ncbi:uncharacterized protein BO80DRAFT_227403 [Aspergillus ibericus CBS 121593]|uniref:Uncharacterized protein n=1 Tax=Aspergillus ibericus CBS 121593 TaxID=1448316 RepID=A0A395GLQ4_9EURO|nr:hypothetical protein BO80DRAFT_227403 [Aspergillus ibericus CBS 121593]RAK96441.1 hypothetical protein BO80DRAFT_227403 [Aspergillus ibericus CBS 121593]